MKSGPPHAKYRLVFEDHFDGTALNESEWSYRVGDRLGGKNLPGNVYVRDGRLVVKFAKEIIDGEACYTGGGVISKRLFGYGYYETKGKLWGGSGGLHSSFWTMGISGDGIHSPIQNAIIEIDGYEVDSGRPSLIGLNVHYYVGTHKTEGGMKGLKDYRKIDTSKEEFVFGFEWLPNQINWYLNGEHIRCLENPQFYGPQNVWLTGLGCQAFDRHIDDRLLPGESSWDYFRFYQIDLPGVNLVVNPGFEYNKNNQFEDSFIRDLSVPVGWCKEGLTPEASCVFETDEAYAGECVLRHNSTEHFQVSTKVSVPLLPDADYSLSAMVRIPAGGNHRMVVSDMGRGVEWSLQLASTQGVVWSRVCLDSMRISGGSCTIAFVSDAEAECPLEVDDVLFVQTTGEPHIELASFPEDEGKPYFLLGDILVDGELPGSGYVEYGEWHSSGLPGFVLRSRYAAPDPNHYAIWKPELREPGEYRVSFYNICHEARAKKAKVEVVHQGGIVEKIISQQGTSGWIELGTFWLEQGDYVKLSALFASTGGGLAADTVKFEPVKLTWLRTLVNQSWLFMVGQSKALIHGKVEKMHQGNPGIKPMWSQDEIMVPVAFVASAFGAGTIHSDREKAAVDIFYEDYMIRFRDGADTMQVSNREIALQAPAFRKDQCLFAPLSDMVDAFGKKVVFAANGLVIVSDRNTEVKFNKHQEVVEQLKQLFA